jgi:hypothetical protein
MHAMFSTLYLPRSRRVYKFVVKTNKKLISLQSAMLVDVMRPLLSDFYKFVTIIIKCCARLNKKLILLIIHAQRDGTHKS